MTEESAALMRIQTVPVERQFVDAEIRMVGKVDYDETRLAYITAWVPGRLDKLYVDYTGVRVHEGDHMVYLYSPELISAQEELRQARKTAAGLAPGTPAGRTAEATLDAARERLRLWGLTPEQIATAEDGEFSDHITIYAPVGGTVIERNGREGMYVETGTRIYTLADLDQMWVQFDAYESDIPWLRYGQHVEFTTEAYQGEVFEGMIVFIDPFLDPKTRTAKVRVNFSNTNGKLKPEMFVRGVVHSRVAEGGRVMDPALTGKWVSPMHPEIVQDTPGKCSVCGMDLVPAEELGYVAGDELESSKPLVIPVSAALITGTRAIVYVRVPNAEKPTFEGREIVLGPRAGDYYIVREGLSEGEQVVVNGNFKIDSALQILAKPSMMLPDTASDTQAEEAAEIKAMKAPDEFKQQLGAVYQAYLPLQEALAADDLQSATAAAKSGRDALQGIDMKLLQEDAHMAWMPQMEAIASSFDTVSGAADLETARTAFEAVAENLANAIRAFGINNAPPVFMAHCPMALDGKGANWLQRDRDIKNPYFGAAMLNCGDIVTELGKPAVKEDSVVHGTVPEAFQQQLGAFYKSYLTLQEALAADDPELAQAAAKTAGESLHGIDMELLEGKAHMAWMPLATSIKESLAALEASADLEAMRTAFEPINENLTEAIKQFGIQDGPPVYVAHCPMALDGKGANWLQKGEEINNPYFGSAMLRCGDIVEQVEAAAAHEH